MELTTTKINRLLSNVINRHVDDETVKSLGMVAETTEATHCFVDSLLASQSPSGTKDAVAVYGSMRILEEIAEKSELSACILMAHLWLISNALQLHDICDSIDIWLSNCKSPVLNQHLVVLASSQSDDSVRRRFEQLAT